MSKAHKGLRYIITSTYSEQNDASLADKVHDDHTRAVEQFIVKVIKRTGGVISERQKDLFSREAGYGEATKKMNSNDIQHLKDERKYLHKRPYHHYLQEYQDGTSYNVK